MHRQDDLHDDENPPSAPNPPSRRGFLRTAGLAGAGVAALGPIGAAPASARTAAPGAPPVAAARGWNPDPGSLQFTLAVMPDTQFLYWGSQGSVNPAPREASFRYIIGADAWSGWRPARWPRWHAAPPLAVHRPI